MPIVGAEKRGQGVATLARTHVYTVFGYIAIFEFRDSESMWQIHYRESSMV